MIVFKNIHWGFYIMVTLLGCAIITAIIFGAWWAGMDVSKMDFWAMLFVACVGEQISYTISKKVYLWWWWRDIR